MKWRVRMLGLVAGFLLPVVGNAADAWHPLEPLDTSSPRATIASFLAVTDEAGRRLLVFRQSPSRETEARVVSIIQDKGARLFDLSQIPPAARDDLAGDTFFLLWEVMARVELPDLEDIPGADDLGPVGDGAAEPLARWRVPHTEITIARIEEGPRAGEYLFSADSVARALSFFQATKELPYQRPMPFENVYRYLLTTTGWWIPPAWVEALPGWAQTPVLEQVLWKWIALLLVVSIAAIAVILVYKVGRGIQPAGVLTSHLVRLSTPLTVMALAQLTIWLGNEVLVLSGPIDPLLGYLVRLVNGATWIWILWVSVGWIAESIIHSPRIHPESLDANIIRLVVRSLAVLAVLAMLFRVGDDIGLPIYGLLAGAGVGGIAVALAAKSTLENFIGALNLFTDRPVRVGDVCRFDDDHGGGWRPVGRVEAIGLRSVKIRRFDRSLITIPNADFAQRQITNLSTCDRFLLSTTIGLRYETTDDQLRFVLAELRELLHAHPMTMHTPAEPLWVRFVGFGESSLDIKIRVYIKTSSYHEFLAIQEDILLRMIKIVKRAGTGIAFPSQTLYLTRDGGLDAEAQQDAERRVREWASAQELPFPDFDEDYLRKITDTLDYPPQGSPKADRG